jgi:RNA polymerase sigma-70 factor (ECF subfamily)
MRLVGDGRNVSLLAVDVTCRSKDIRVGELSRTATDEADFVRRVKEFDEQAWDELYNAYFPKMYRYLYVHTGDREAAEDLAAEVFEQACKGINRFQFRGIPLSSWLYKVAHNVMVDWNRRRKRSPQVAVGDIAGPDHSDRVAARDELAQAMSGLTQEQRQVLALRHVEGHSAASAGEIMGKKENAVRALEFRALASLRRAMSRTQGEGVTT